MAATTVWLKELRLVWVAACGGALSLAACTPTVEPMSQPSTAVLRPAEPPAVVAPPPPRPTRKPAPPPPQVAAVSPPGAGPSPAPDAESASQPIDPQQVIGLDEGNAAELLGPPEQSKESPPATIWHYVTRDCEIDVYFYLDLQSRVMRALQYEVRSNDFVDRRPERCFQQLVGEHRERSGSSISAYRPH
jgi:hypothetical protein